ncbi:MAG: hypothetical protein CL853_06985 [Crocinitomicaceae bacterium]|nr:hypothetical protein [Crocinitomicaceae bacterium]
MKKITLYFLFFLLTSNLLSQKFEGSIKYTLDYELPEIMEPQRSMLPNEMITYCKKDYSRVEQKTAMGDQIVISNSKSGESTLLMNMMGQKMAIEVSNEENKETSTNKPSIIYAEESKNIAGYLCKKAIYTIYNEQDQDSVAIDVFYSEEISPSFNSQFKHLDGFPLEYAINTNGMTITFLAIEITNEKLSKDLFLIPNDYQKLSLEDFKSMMGQ